MKNEIANTQIAQVEALLAKLREKLPPETTDVMVLPNGNTYVKTYLDNLSRVSYGKIISAKDIESIGYILAAYNNVTIGDSCHRLECSIPSDGTRCTIIYEPMSLKASMYLRFHKRNFLTIDQLQKQGLMTEEQRARIELYVRARRNIIIAGGTDTGKTTLLSAIINLIDKREHLILIEDTREIICEGFERVSSLLVSGKETGTDAVHASLRMDPDRIIYGEVRDGAALELCKCWNTGHTGGLTTLHADSVDDVYQRLYDMIQEVVITPPENTIRHALQTVIYIDFVNGQRKITAIRDFYGENKK